MLVLGSRKVRKVGFALTLVLGIIGLVDIGMATPSGASANPSCSNCEPPLNYLGGHVMGEQSSSPGDVTITPIFWGADGDTFSSSYTQIISRYISDVAAASGSANNVFAVSTQYYEQSPGGTKQYIQYHVTAGIEVDPSDNYPAPYPGNAQGCQPDSGFNYCVDDSGLQTELSSVLASNNLPTDDSHLYMIFLPPQVELCYKTGTSADEPCSSPVSGQDYMCSYHSLFSTNGSSVIYAGLAYPDLSWCADLFNGPQAPNGNSFADAEVSEVSHEANESITDYSSDAWLDASQNEEADQCEYVYGSPLGSTDMATDSSAAGTMYNQVINGDYYYMQDEFSNTAYSLGQGDVTSPTDPKHWPGGNTQVPGCVQRPTATQLELGPMPATITSGGTETYLATGYNQSADGSLVRLGIETDATSFTISPDGTGTGAKCTGSTCTATEPGSYTITGTDGATTGRATLTVVPIAGYTVKAWGWSAFGQLGNGNSIGPDSCTSGACGTTPVPVVGTSGGIAISGVTAIAASSSGEHSLALLNNGTVVAWGYNADGELGDGTNNGPDQCEGAIPCSTTPVAVNGLTGVTAIAAGEDYSLALLGNGTVMAWGANEFGQLGDGSTTASDTPVAVNLPAGDVVTAIAASDGTSMALLNDGTVMAWGNNSGGELGDGLSNGPAICPYDNKGCSTVPVAVGGPNDPPLSGVTAIAVGGASLALLGNGTVMAWGDNGFGELGTGSITGPDLCNTGSPCSTTPVAVSGLSDVNSISATAYFSMALLNNGTVETWGFDTYGELGNGISGGSGQCFNLACSPLPVVVGGQTPLSGVTAIAAGGADGLALLGNGSVMSWGYNADGELGDGLSSGPDSCSGFACSATPVSVTGLSSVGAISVGNSSALAATSGGGEQTGGSAFSLSRSSGPIIGGTSVTITGSNFEPVTSVTFGGYAGTVTTETANEIVVTTPPANSSGAVDVAVTTPGGTYADAGAFTYVAGTCDPTIYGANSAIAVVGRTFTFRVTTCSSSVPTIKGAHLPSGLHLVDDGDGAATISGTPAPHDSGVYAATITATVRKQAAATESLLITVANAPVLTSKLETTVHTGVAFTYPITTKYGYPVPTISTSSALPDGVSLTDNGNGTATLNGTPGPNAGGTYPVTIADANIVAQHEQAFTLTVYQAPGITSAASDTVFAGATMTSFAVAASGYPAPKLTASGLPSGVKLNGGLIAGTPKTAGTYTATITAKSNAGTTAQTFTLHVDTITGMAGTPDAKGYWLVGNTGAIWPFGDATSYGPLPGLGVSATNIVGMAATPDGGGYWMVDNTGGIHTFGDAVYYGSLPGLVSVTNIVGMAATPDGRGYWMVDNTGGIFSFGDASFHGSLPGVTNIVGIASTSDGGGYWIADSDGDLYPFGDATSYGSPASLHVSDITDIASTPDGGGYWFVASDGGVYAYGDATFWG